MVEYHDRKSGLSFKESELTEMLEDVDLGDLSERIGLDDLPESGTVHYINGNGKTAELFDYLRTIYPDKFGSRGNMQHIEIRGDMHGVIAGRDVNITRKTVIKDSVTQLK